MLENEEKYVTFSNDSDDILRYSCMFPETSINLKKEFNVQNTSKGKTFFDMPKDFFRSLLIHKNLIQEGVYKVLPEIIKETGDEENDWRGIYSTWSLSGKRTYYEGMLDKEINVLNPDDIFLSTEKIDKLYFEFPWLYGVGIEDYINIVNKNRTLYDKYCITIQKFIKAVHNGDYSTLKQEMKEANNSIKIELEKAQNNLKRKGIQTAVSIAFTFIPIVLPLQEDQKIFLSTLLGTTSVNNVFKSLSDEIATLHEIGKSSPFWLMYQWQKKVKI